MYYQRLYGPHLLKNAVLQMFDIEIPDLPPHPENITFEETHEVTAPSYSTPALDIRALEMMSVDELVHQLYQDQLILRSPNGFATRVPILCEYFRTPVFRTSQLDFYKLVIAAFDKHPDRALARCPPSSPVIHQVRFAKGNHPVVGQISTIADPFA